MGGEDKNLSHQAPATPACGDTFMVLQENPEGFGGGISPSLLTARAQSAMANCTLQVSPALQFHVKKSPSLPWEHHQAVLSS